MWTDGKQEMEKVKELAWKVKILMWILNVNPVSTL